TQTDHCALALCHYWRTTEGRRLTSSVLKGADRNKHITQHHSALALAFSTTAERRSEVAGSRIRTWHLMPTERMVPPPGASPPMRMTASWSGLTDPTAYKSVCGTKLHPMASSPRIINGGTAQMPKLCKKPRRSSSSLACSGTKPCATQASLGGKPPSFATVSIP